MTSPPGASLVAMTSVSIGEILGELTPVERKLAPAVLNIAGDVELLRTSPKVALVGSRRAGHEGLDHASRVARALVKLGATVVSGLAEGIDTAAHRAAIEAGGRTFAVIGTGLDVAYPRKNRALQERLASRFAVVSQFPSGSPPSRGSFPQRNRTMALLSDALVIVEASETSGTVNQGWETLRLGRTLLLLEPAANDEALSWPGEMRRYGAGVLRMDDLAGRGGMRPGRHSTTSQRPGLGFGLAVGLMNREARSGLVRLPLGPSPIAVFQRPGEPAPVLSPLDLVETGLGIGEHPHPVPAPFVGTVAPAALFRACHRSVPLSMMDWSEETATSSDTIG